MKIINNQREALKRAKAETGTAAVVAMFALKAVEKSYQELSKKEREGEKGEKLMARLTALTLAIEEYDRVSDNLQRAIETY